MHQYRTIPNLSDLMREKKATNQALASKAGVATRTVVNARRGKALRPDLATAIAQALERYKFTRDSRGGK
jgi:DNA-binding XRE family transcriptional regulator